jgi:hypothetical protein
VAEFSVSWYKTPEGRDMMLVSSEQDEVSDNARCCYYCRLALGQPGINVWLLWLLSAYRFSTFQVASHGGAIGYDIANTYYNG